MSCNAAFSQRNSDSALSKSYLLQKSRNQNTAGWVLLAGGTSLAVVGGIIFGNSNFLSGNDNSTDAGGYLMIGGIVADLVSIPFFISSSKNARRAAALSFYYRTIQPNQFIAKRGTMQPTVSLKFHF